MTHVLATVVPDIVEHVDSSSGICGIVDEGAVGDGLGGGVAQVVDGHGLEKGLPMGVDCAAQYSQNLIGILLTMYTWLKMVIVVL